jgi:hypothetical protein
VDVQLELLIGWDRRFGYGQDLYAIVSKSQKSPEFRPILEFATNRLE